MTVGRQGGEPGLERAPAPARHPRREADSARTSSARRSQTARNSTVKTSNRPRISLVRCRLSAKSPFANRILLCGWIPARFARTALQTGRNSRDPRCSRCAGPIGHGARSTPSSRLDFKNSDSVDSRTDFAQTVWGVFEKGCEARREPLSRLPRRNERAGRFPVSEEQRGQTGKRPRSSSTSPACGARLSNQTFKNPRPFRFSNTPQHKFTTGEAWPWKPDPNVRD
jgi:hypothetical protein